MTNEELIAKIKAEIEKLIERYGSVKAKGILQEGYKGGRLIGYEDALNVIKRIQEKLEKPMPAKVGKGLEVEAVNYIFDNGLNLSPRVATDFARHFYELGRTRTAEIYDELEYNRQRAEESVQKDLELTWEDMQLIWQIVDIANEECDIKKPEWMYGSKPFFTEVLRRFKEKKK